MSDGWSDTSLEDTRRRRHSLPTEEFRVAGNPNPLGIPFYRNLPVMGLEQEERASLLGSQQYVFQSSGSDTYSGDFFDEVSDDCEDVGGRGVAFRGLGETPRSFLPLLVSSVTLLVTCRVCCANGGAKKGLLVVR